MNRRIVFKCSFGGTDGWGHVVRCSALASVFRDRGWQTWLWTQSDASQLPEDVAAAFGSVTADDALEADALLVDEMYTEQERLAALVRKWRERNGKGIVAGIDDMQRRSMAGFDLVLNTEIGLREASYAAKNALLGEAYALLRSGFRTPTDLGDLSAFDGSVPVLLMVGGTDAFGYLPRVLDSLARMDSVSLAPVVVGDGGADLSRSLLRFPANKVLNRIDSAEFAAWMRYCRAGVIGCGSSLYEAAALELPFVGLSIVDNQMATARKVEAHWGMPILHLEERLDGALGLSRPLLDLLERPRLKYSDVDTKGADRVCDRLLELLG